MKIMKLVLSTLLFLSTYACEPSGPAGNLQRVDELLWELVDQERSAGVAFSWRVASFLSRSASYGWADPKARRPLSDTARFRIASLTKPITATAVLQLVEAKAIALDQTLDNFFPDFPDGDRVTVYHLLTHTSGINNWYEGGMPEDEPDNFPMCEAPHRYLARMDRVFLFEPGIAWAYSNSGYVLLGEIIEIASGMSYEAYLRERIFRPAAMRHTELEYIEEPGESWVKGYAPGQGEQEGFTDPAVYHMPFSAGGLRSTTGDMMRFLTALEKGELVSKETYAHMTSYAELNDGRPVYENPFSPDGKPVTFPRNIKKYGYGMGFQIAENFGRVTIFHGGDIAGFNSALLIVPHNSVKLIILSNTEYGIMGELQKIEELAVNFPVHRWGSRSPAAAGGE